MQLFVDKMNSDIGYIWAVSNGDALTHVYFNNQFELNKIKHPNPIMKADSIINQFFDELNQYLLGKSKEFKVKIQLSGTDFQKKCWLALKNINYGSTVSYSDFAKLYLKQNQVRPFSGNIGKNPLAIILPCHRVIGKNGSLTGFAGGLDTKQYLLDLEKAH